MEMVECQSLHSSSLDHGAEPPKMHLSTNFQLSSSYLEIGVASFLSDSFPIVVSNIDFAHSVKSNQVEPIHRFVNRHRPGSSLRLSSLAYERA